MYTDWFIEYSSYVILERAIPQALDGLKPVQRRILFSMKELHDERYHKVANIIGNTMKYHPHGDAAIGDALVRMGQFNFLIDTQGNWGDIRTGDKAAASRYIEARLKPIALDICFNNQLSEWKDSYDSRNKEPIILPLKFPLLLQHGSEGIAVGLSTKIMPHNFNELLKASINILKNKPFKILPDFYTPCSADFTNYNEGKKGGKVRIRTEISIVDNSTLKISGVPYGVTTGSLIESIVKANELGKIKIKNIEDNTSENIEIIIYLKKNVSPTITIDALFAFTQCEISISPNCCVIKDNTPCFTSVNEVLKISTENTVNLLRKELINNKNALNKKWHQAMLEKIFIKEKIYHSIEESSTWDEIVQTIQKAILPFANLLHQEITLDDITKLTDLKIKKISKFDLTKSIDKIKQIESDLQLIENNIKNIIEYSIKYFSNLLNRYGSEYNRMTKIMTFDNIQIQNVAVLNKKLFVNRKNGFIGYSLKNDEFICECSDIENIIVFLKNGQYLVTTIEDKKFIGKNIIHIDKWSKNNHNMVYNVVYYDGLTKINFVKRFSVLSIVKDKIYNLTSGNDGSQIIYFSANPNSEWEILDIKLKDNTKIRKNALEYNFEHLSIKGRNSKGNILVKHPIKKIERKQLGSSTLGGMKIWLDNTIGRLNTTGVGDLLGLFNSGDSILVIYKDGSYMLTSYNMSNRYNMKDCSLIIKYNENTILSALYYHGKHKNYYIKRFKIETLMIMKIFKFISEDRGSKLLLITTAEGSIFKFNYRTRNNEKKYKELDVDQFIDVKGWKSLGNKLIGLSKLSKCTIIHNQSQDCNDGNSFVVDAKDNNLPLTLFD